MINEASIFMSDITLTLPEHLIRRLEDRAESQQQTIPEVIEAILEQQLDDEDSLRFKPELQQRLERHVRGEEKVVDFAEAMKALGLDD